MSYIGFRAHESDTRGPAPRIEKVVNNTPKGLLLELRKTQPGQAPIMGARKDFTTCEGVPADLLAGICANPECARHMRKRGVTKKLAPHTLAYGHSGKCKSCVQPNTLRSIIATDMKSDSGVEQTISGLQRYLQARNERGVQAEPDNGIRWGGHIVA